MNTWSLLLTAGLCTVPLPADAAEPTAMEQYMLELINRTRADGNTEAALYGMSGVDEGSPAIFGEAWTIQPVVPPLVWNEQLTGAARGQAQALFDAGFVSGDPHNFGGLSPAQRAAAAGFVTCGGCPKATTVSGYFPGMENFGFAGRSTPYSAAQLEAEIPLMYQAMFADLETPGRLSRITVMNPWFRETGLGIVSGTQTGQGRIYLIADFGTAAPGTQAFLTGVAYRDTIAADAFYTPGEGLGGLKVEVWQGGAKITDTLTSTSGGYRVAPGPGTWQIKLVNAEGGVSDMGTVTVGTENVKLDSRSPVFTPTPAGGVNLRIVQSGSSVRLTWDDPSWSLAVSGNALTGPWTVIATASPATVILQPGIKFFRCQK